MVFQHKALGFPGLIIGVDDRDKVDIKHLCFVYIPISEVSDLIEQWANVIFDSLHAVNIL